MTAKVFGIGLSRTGTTSLARALTLLGYRTAHFGEHFHEARGIGTWLEGDFAADELGAWDAAADLPIATYFAQLDECYPGSRFVLTVRDVDDWVESARAHWANNPIGTAPLDRYRSLVRVATYGSADFDEERFRRVASEHRRVVERHFARRPDDLLVLDICAGEGWERLCSFLGRAAPAEEFPWANRTAAAG